MNANDKPTPASTDAARPQAGSAPTKTPNADMQAEDAGSGESATATDSGTAAGRVMKQTSKTASESKR